MAVILTQFPTPPSSADPANFDTRADAFLGHFPTFVAEANQLSVEVETNANTVVNAYSGIGDLASQATAASGVTAWTSGSHAINVCKYSLIDYRIYRKIASTNNYPLEDPYTSVSNSRGEWALATSWHLFSEVTSTTPITGKSFMHYVLTNTGAAQQVNLPTTGLILKNSIVGVTVANNRVDNKVNPGASFSINGGTNGDILVLNKKFATIHLLYVEANKWRIIKG